MITSRQTVAGAAQFTGAVGAGLQTWITEYSYAIHSLSVTAGILGYAYNGRGGAAHAVLLVLRRPGGAATEAVVMEDRANVVSFTQMCSGEGLIVPREAGVIWELALTTVGKAATATFTVWWGPRRCT